MDIRGLRSLFLRRTFGVVLALAVSAGLAGSAAPSGTAFAQEATTRTVLGKVVDKSGAPLKGAVIYLKDSHTLAIKSAVATDDGSYRFGQLAQNADYELWAESDGKKSSVKNISSFDNRKEFDFTLKIDK